MDNNENNTNPSRIPPNLPKKLPPQFVKNNPQRPNLPPTLPPNLRKNMQGTTAGQPNGMPSNGPIPPQNNIIQPTNEPKQKNIDDILSRSTGTQAYYQDEVVDKVIHKDDKHLLKHYTQRIAYARKAIKKVKKPMVFTDEKLRILKEVFTDSLPDMLWFYPRRKIKALFNKFDMAISYGTAHRKRGIFTAIIIVALIMGIVGAGIWLAITLTRNLSPQDNEVSGEIQFTLSGTEGSASKSSDLKIDNARLNQNLYAAPYVVNNTNAYLYLRFYIRLDYVIGKNYIGVDINDLSVSCNKDSEKWYVDNNVAYYMATLAPKETLVLFDTFQINGDPSLEGDWSGRSLTATVYADVCQVVGESQSFPPGWSMIWYGMMVS